MVSTQDLLQSEFAFCRAVWTPPLPGEEDAPAERIIHSRVLNFPVPTRLARIGWKEGDGYCKCGGERTRDWIRAMRVLMWQDAGWRVLHELQNLARPAGEETAWLDLEVEAASLCIEVRRCGIDGWWPSWNVANSALVVEGEAPDPCSPAVRGLSLAVCDLAALPEGLQAEHRPGEVRYRTPFLEVGFRIGRPGFTYFSIDDTGTGAHRNLLRNKAEWRNALREYCVQGMALSPVGDNPRAAFFHFHATGTTAVRANHVTYEVHFGDAIRYRLQWEVLPDSLRLTAERASEHPVRAWRSSAWHIAFDASVTQTSALGRVVPSGETGRLELPLLLHAPGSGTLEVSARGDVAWRSDAARPCLVTSGELKLGEVAQPEGDYLLRAGTHRAEIEFAISRRQCGLPGASEAVQRAVRRCAVTAFPFRADTATLANNAISIHVPMCMDTWADLAARIGPLGAGVDSLDLLRASLERWLAGAPGYASGVSPGGTHLMEDEYVMTGVCCLYAVAKYIAATGSAEFLHRHTDAIARQVQLLQARDLDGDGLLESPYRTGIGGSGQWSSNWYDAVSFGWKDAFSNALLYRTVIALDELSAAHPATTGSIDLKAWLQRVRDNYSAAFLNPETGWFAGWLCGEGRLHDYAFLPVNGAAVSCGLVTPAQGRDIMGRLWRELQRTGVADFRLGLPGNLWPIPSEDMAAPQQGKPFGFFENGGLTHAQSHHFVNGLATVGMKSEADELLEALCASLADASAFGGCGTDAEWRTHDGTPCGYEGLLCDQFGLLTFAFDRFDGASPRRFALKSA